MVTPSIQQHTDWPELLTALFQRMTEHNTEIEFVDLQVMVPVTSQPDSRQAPYRLNGVIRVRNGGGASGGR
jgi:hypothetical protein